MKYFSIALLALTCAACLSSQGLAAETTICTGMKGIEVIEGPLRVNPEDELTIPPGIDEEGAGPLPSQQWPDLQDSLTPVTLRCFANVMDRTPAQVKTFEVAPSSCTFRGGTLTCNLRK